MKKMNVLFAIMLGAMTAAVSAEEKAPAKAPEKAPAAEAEKNYVKNPSFEELDKDGKPKFWALRGKAELVKTEKGNVVKLSKGEAYHLLVYGGGELNQKPYERKIAFSFTASGKGKLYFYFVRYTDTPDAKAKNGYTRKIHKNTPEDKASFTFTLTETPQTFSGEYTIKANEWVGIFFNSAEAVLDDVSVRLLK
ncbi:MAG: hypothetical protein J6331_03465 [Lentisphaeria bacterium]|nr:hypothetical protein [Lentisphaeria bacterium]